MSENSENGEEDFFINDQEDTEDDETEAMEQTTHLLVFLEEGFYDN